MLFKKLKRFTLHLLKVHLYNSKSAATIKEMHIAFWEYASLEFSLKVKYSLDAHLKLVIALLDLGTFEMSDLATSSTKIESLLKILKWQWISG